MIAKIIHLKIRIIKHISESPHLGYILRKFSNFAIGMLISLIPLGLKMFSMSISDLEILQKSIIVQSALGNLRNIADTCIRMIKSALCVKK